MKKILITLLLAPALYLGTAAFIENVKVTQQDSPSIDAFGRARVANPTTIFDSKLTFNNQPLIWDEELETGSGITGNYTQDTASVIISSTASTAGKFTRQTFNGFTYQPGKSQLIYMTGVLDKQGGGTGVQRRIGYFDDDNGLFFEDDEGTVKVVIRSSTTGSAVDTKVEQANWNYDPMDGSGPSGVTIDWSKTQIFSFDFEWLGVGRVRFGLVVDGKVYYVHYSNHANSEDQVYMSTPNLPLRYQMVTTASSPASKMEVICSSVISEGGAEDTGVIRSFSTGGTHISADSDNTIYPVIGVRLQSDCIRHKIAVLGVSMMETTGNDDFEWSIRLNPVVSGTFTYSDENFSILQAAYGVTSGSATCTGGVLVASGFSSGNSSQVSTDVKTARWPGADISGNRDTLVLCVRPVGGSSNLDIEGSMIIREFQ